MAFQHMMRAFFCKDLTTNEKLMLLTLAAFADNENDTLFVYEEKLSDLTGLDLTETREALAELDDHGLISRQSEARYFVNSHITTNDSKYGIWIRDSKKRNRR